MANRGRPKKFHRLENGQEVFGLHRRADGIFYAYEDDGRRKSFGKEEKRALYLFHQWQAAKKPRTVEIPEYQPLDDSILEAMSPDDRTADVFAKKIPIPENLFWQTVRELFYADPKRFAQMIGEPRIGYLDQIPVPAVPARLAAIWPRVEEYRRMRNHHPAHIANAKAYWLEFVAFVRKATTDEITYDDFDKYAAEMRRRQAAKRYSRRWYANRFAEVKQVFNDAAKVRLIPAAEKNRLKEEWQVPLAVGKKDKPRGKITTITPEQFQAMLRSAGKNKRDYAVLLLLANCAYTPADLGLQWQEIDLEFGYIVHDREKTGGTYRSAVLWPETIAALKALRSPAAKRRDFVFAKRTGAILDKDDVWPKVKRYAKTAGAENISPRCFRKTTATAVNNVNWKQYLVLMGRELPGEEDSYIAKSDPFYTRDVVNAARAYYFRS